MLVTPSQRAALLSNATSTYVFVLHIPILSNSPFQYYNRWANHEQSAKLSVELYAKTEKKMEEMQMTSDLTWIEVQFMKKAVDEVSKCRMTLKWTYAMAYYLESNNQKELFEDNQRFEKTYGFVTFGSYICCRDLERAVEELSELIEQPLEPEVVATLRQKVTDKTVSICIALRFPELDIYFL